MKIEAIANVQLAGYGIVKRGKIIDFAKDKIDERIAANFVDAGSGKRLKCPKQAKSEPELFKKSKEEMIAEQEAAKADARKKLLAELGIDGVKEQLAEFGIPFNAEMTEDKLCDLLLDRIGE